MRTRRTATVALLALGVAGLALGDPPQDKPVPPGLAKKGGVPPGLAKKGGLPPGLARKFGEELPEKAWIAFHPTRDDGAWFLIDMQWTLMTGFSVEVKGEVREARKRPASVPPVPLPDAGVKLHVVLFE
jgi:hypothetical protein